MSALLAQATATFDYKGANVTLSCSSPTELIEALAKFGIATAANDTPTKPKAAPAATPAPTPAPQAQEAAGNGSASTGTPASAPAADSGSAAAGDAPTITYDHVKAKVLALSKVKRELAVETLGQFKTVGGDKVDHGNKLQLQDYPAFIAAADKALAGAAK